MLDFDFTFRKKEDSVDVIVRADPSVFQGVKDRAKAGAKSALNRAAAREIKQLMFEAQGIDKDRDIRMTSYTPYYREAELLDAIIAQMVEDLDLGE